MTMMKSIREFHYCVEREKRCDFSGDMWPTIEQHWKLFYPVDNHNVFEQHPVLYQLIRNDSCSKLRHDEYLRKVTNAIVCFGEQGIIEALNKYCEDPGNAPELKPQDGNPVPVFRNWSDVTRYVGNRHNPNDPSWLREQKSRVFDEIPVIAARNGIEAADWKALMKLYVQRNAACHQQVNKTDADFISHFVNEVVTDSNEQKSVNALHDWVLRWLPQTRRGHR